MPAIDAVSRTVYIASLSKTFAFDTILSQDADFGLPGFGALLIYSNPESRFFFNVLFFFFFFFFQCHKTH